MKLIFYKKVNNFGDSLNPMIFNTLLPDFFDEDESSVFIGIGSIIQFTFPNARQKIIFSSGYAYGEVPALDNTHSVICVRGPLTADKLGLGRSLAITDGASLLKTFTFPKEEKVHNFSFIPHHESSHFFDWEKICGETGVHYIDPLDENKKIIKQILQSEIVIAEAMHGAIVADTLRVPWIPVKCYPLISEFKWHDWTMSLELDYRPVKIDSLYNDFYLQSKIKHRLQKDFPIVSTRLATCVYRKYQNIILYRKVIKKFTELKYIKPFLSNEAVLDNKVNDLVEKLHILKRKIAKVQL